MTSAISNQVSQLSQISQLGSVISNNLAKSEVGGADASLAGDLAEVSALKTAEDLSMKTLKMQSESLGNLINIFA